MTSELMPNLPDRVCIWDADNNDPTSTRGWTTSFSEGHQNIYVRANENTRAAPDVPELVRYTLWHTLGRFTASPDGEYVRHDQAAAVSTALKSELFDMRKERDLALEWRDHDKERAEVAEDKLSQIEKQEAVAWRWRTNYLDNWCYSDRKPEFSSFDLERGIVHSLTPLYTAPVASDADLRAENERLHVVLKPLIEHAKERDVKSLEWLDSDTVRIPVTIGELRAALNPSEPQT